MRPDAEFQAFYEANYGRIVAMVAAVLGGREQAEDVAQENTRPARSLSFCGVLWTDPHGRHLITQCGAAQYSIAGGRLTRIHLRQVIPASPIGYANTFAW